MKTFYSVVFLLSALNAGQVLAADAAARAVQTLDAQAQAARLLKPEPGPSVPNAKEANRAAAETSTPAADAQAQAARVLLGGSATASPNVQYATVSTPATRFSTKGPTGADAQSQAQAVLRGKVPARNKPSDVAAAARP